MSVASVGGITQPLFDLAYIDAVVLNDVAYGTTQVLTVTVEINEGAVAAAGDRAVHAAVLPGEATGNGRYSSLDVQRILRVTTGLDTGHASENARGRGQSLGLELRLLALRPGTMRPGPGDLT